jgi:hypothetical protein
VCFGLHLIWLHHMRTKEHAAGERYPGASDLTPIGVKNNGTPDCDALPNN